MGWTGARAVYRKMGRYVNRFRVILARGTRSKCQGEAEGRGYIHDQPNVANRVTPIDFLSFVHIIGCC